MSQPENRHLPHASGESGAGCGCALAIAVPTYNRPEQLRRCITALASQLTHDCRLHIFDNASAVPAADIVIPILDRVGFRAYSITRHPSNLGAHGNLYHCLEGPALPWLWVIGDDDTPTPNAVAMVREAIAAYASARMIVFEVAQFRGYLDGKRPEHPEAFDSLAKFLRSDALYMASLISAGVYNMGVLRPHLGHAYRWGSSYFPHIAMMIASLQERPGHVVYVPTSLVEFMDDGVQEPDKAHIFGNMRYLSRMLESDDCRAALMASSFMKNFVGEPADRAGAPSWRELVAAAVFADTPEGRDVLRRSRVIMADSFQFDDPGCRLPVSALRFVWRHFLAVSAGAVFRGWLRPWLRARWGDSTVRSAVLRNRQQLVP